MYGVVIFFHVVACILLITVILIQAGRGGGLVESFSGVESIFGTKTSSFLTKTTTILASVFFITCLGLAIVSAHRSKSLMTSAPEKTVVIPQKETSLPKAELPVVPVTEEKSDLPKI